MKSIKRILLAYDYDITTEPALRKAEYLAKQFNSELILVHAVEHIPYHYGLNYWHVIYDEIKPRMEAVCASLAERGVNVQKPVILEGRPYDVIASTATVMDVNLIVIGAGKISRLDTFVGTTAGKIVRNALHPVCLVHPAEKKPEIERILCSVDFSLASNQVMAAAIHMARTLHAQLDILHVAPKSKPYPGLDNLPVKVIDLEIGIESQEQTDTNDPDLENQMQLKVDKLFADYLRKFDLTEVKYTKMLRQGEPNKEIILTSKKKRYDLLLVGTVGQNAISRILVGNTTEKILRKLPCSLMTVRYQNLFRVLNEIDNIGAGTESQLSEESHLQELSAFIERHYQKGKEYVASGRYQEAIKEFHRCINKDPHFYAAFDEIAHCYQQAGDGDKARHYTEQAKNHRRFLLNLQARTKE